MKLRNVLIFGMSGLLLLIMMVSLAGFFEMRELNKDMVSIVQDRYHKINLVNKIPLQVLDTSRALRGLLLVDNNASPARYMEIINNSNSEIIEVISTLGGISQNNEIEKIAQLRGAFENYRDYENEIITLVRSGGIEEAQKIILSGSPLPSDKLIQAVKDINDLEEQQIQGALNQAQTVFYRGLIIFIILGVCGLLLGIIISLWIIKRLIGDISQLTGAMKGIASYQDKTSLPRLEIIKKSELGQLTEVFNEMAIALEKHARQESELMQAFKEQHWLQSKIAETHALFQGIQNVEQFSVLLIQWVCQTVGASYGNFYIRSISNSNIKLINRASYAGNGQAVGTAVFSPGEGLIGQCFLENRVINLTDDLDQYLEITTGFGKIAPKHVKLLPVEFETKVVAVIELASLLEFSALEREFMEQVRWNIGIILNRIEEHAQIQKLLQDSQMLTEELQTQSEELQTQQEELRTFHEKLEQQYQETELKNKQLLHAQVSLEEQAQRLEASSRYKSEFLSNMSHELRTPLNSLLILAKMLWENRGGNLSSKQVEYAKTIWTSGNDLLNLINDILDLSKIESGRALINAERFSLMDVTEELKNQFYPIALEKELGFVITIDKDVPNDLLTDRRYLKQILANLLSNAFKFTDHGQVNLHVQKSAEVQAPGSFPEGKEDSLAFCVSDTGIGIPTDKKKLIFEAFQQVDGTISRKYGGTGLGLYICKELVTLLGGSIDIISREGAGSTFVFILPNMLQEGLSVSEKLEALPVPLNGAWQEFDNQQSSAKLDATNDDREATLPGSQSSSDLTGCVVLVVDDDIRNIFAISAALEAINVKVVFAENGWEALDKMKAVQDIDLILMDIMMPEMDGYETMRSIRQMPEYKDMPIIALTAKAMKGDLEKCLDAGASDYISKPLDIGKLISLIRIWLSR